MTEGKKLRVAATIAGSDSGGGAGIQADLKTFSAYGVHGVSVITCITAQNPKEVLAVQEVEPSVVEKQLEAVFKELRPSAAKTGMLYSERIINVVSEFFTTVKKCPLVVDPVMVATSGAKLLKDDAISALEKKLFPLAKVITPNVDEISVLLNRKIKDVDDFKASAKELYEKYGCAVLAKGGHLNVEGQVVDIFYNGKEELIFASPRYPVGSIHGTGCCLSAAIAAGLAVDMKMERALSSAKEYIANAIKFNVKVGKYTALNHNWQFAPDYNNIF